MYSQSNVTFLLLVLASILVAGLIWIAGDIFALFLVGFILAYLFNPVAVWMVNHGFSRPVAAAVITGSMVLMIGALLTLIGPIAYAQLEEMLRVLQTVFTDGMGQLREGLAPYFPALSQIGLGGLVHPSDGAKDALPPGPLAASLLTTLGLTLLAPVVTFYLLKDWPRMMEHLLGEVPGRQRPVARRLARKIDTVLAGFLRGQAWVCLIEGLLFSIGFLSIGLKYGIVIGMIAGALKFLPYLGAAIGLAIAVATSVGQAGWDSFLVGGIFATYFVVEFIDAGILSPRIIGDRVRLPPAMVIFAVLVGGKLLGVIGVFIAIPMFAVGRVLLSFWLHRQRVLLSGRKRRPSPPARLAGPQLSAKDLRLVREAKP